MLPVKHANNPLYILPTPMPSSLLYLPSMTRICYLLNISNIPQFPSGNPNPSGIIPSVAPNLQSPVGGQGGTTQFPHARHNPITTQPTIGTQLPFGTPPMIRGPTPPFGQNIPPALAQYWTQMLQNLPKMTGGKQPAPTIGKPYPGIPNSIWGQGQNIQTQVPTQNQG
jgi:hypothetical protein